MKAYNRPQAAIERYRVLREFGEDVFVSDQWHLFFYPHPFEPINWEDRYYELGNPLDDYFIPFLGKQGKDTSEEAGGSDSMTEDGGAKPTEEDGAEPKIQQASMAVGRESLPTEQGVSKTVLKRL
jgi:hypothetical protein